MVKRLSEINRTSVFAWSPGQQTPLIAAGTAAGALDDSFSNTSELELFKLDLTASSSNGLVSAGKISSNARFNKLAWGNVSEARPHGVIVGGLENGELTLWDPSKMLDGKNDEDAKILSNNTHTGQIRGLDFNKFQLNLLASAGSNNEIYIWDISKPEKPYTPGPKSQKMDDITSVAWNGQVQHILATTSSTGHTVVWDLRNRKEVMTLTAPNLGGFASGQRSISSVVWHPDVATQLVTASEDDSNPVVTLWDLRHGHSPEKTLAGHTKGVLDVSWCRQDSDLLMSCGKDCKTLIWNPNSGELLGDLAQDTNWTFQAEWCPRNPDLLATASFDGKISLYSLQNTESEDSSKVGSTDAAAVDSDPFTAAMNAAASATASSFALRHPPKWLRCPVGASFGFGGKLVSFNNKTQASAQVNTKGQPGQPAAPQPVKRSVHINSVVTDKETVKRSDELEIALEQQSIEQLIEERVQQAKEKDDKESWEVIKTLLAENAREQLMNYLGFQKSEIVAAVAKATAGRNEESAIDEDSKPEEVKDEGKEEIEAEETSGAPDKEEADVDKPEEETEEADNSTSNLFGDDAGDEFIIKTDDSAVPVEEQPQNEGTPAAVIAAAVSREPLQLYSENSSDVDRLITRAVILGDFESAVNVCLANERFSDALLFGICGGGDLLARTQRAYFEHQSKTVSYLRLLDRIIDEDLNSIVATVALEEWTSAIVVLCTFAKTEDFRPLCEALGARLEEAYSNNVGDKAKDYRRHATLCYLAAGNLEKVARTWIAEQEEEAQKVECKSAKASTLQDLIEKVTIFRKAIGFEDPDLFETSTTKMSYEYPLSPLYDKYCEYAELLASQGKLTAALTYLNLTPMVYRKATFDRLSIIRHRVYEACTASIASQFAQPSMPFENKDIGSTHSNYDATQAAQDYSQPQKQTYQQNDTYQQTAYQPYQPPVPQPYQQNAYQPYQPAVSTASTTPYSPQPLNASTNTTAPTNAYQPRPSIPAPPPIAGAASSQQPLPPPPKKAEGAWNDPPMALASAASKKLKSPTMASTPAKRVTSPFPNQPAPSSFVNQQPPSMMMQQQNVLPPPPRNAMPPQRQNIPPPPKNAVPPPPMSRGPPPQQHQGPPMSGPASSMHNGPSMNTPAMGGPPMSGPPMSGPPMSGPPMSGPPMSGPPMSGPPMMGSHMSGPPRGGPYQTR
ncbi:hypothetical protein BDF20DRAFT_905569 [Mycotypha africana]|uniref:uncharacterized protein n=1 Tax=Mycotypha africana TaxID=64632 RepID=UPI0023005B1E|nr:uncharacterized protein BDF20DRAFT_905569 [Mycotypha africana]KAI8981701.1 hypothetical protein BDF20DRAFT_905569 [Mycotypha africana]